ncbi:aminopeptidase [Bartonella clarridgeiae 73]|uniref:Aminopeptidase n=1 Tax=Bartonella clarridgeiae (strain CCUG 45776 / CIP 104772 / 73) TaxID=696125 RepID=E6YG83_BARC7|nr:aminopeptidase [Bartonella clarridgeiae]WCR55521.1 MAG: Aminopeptidase S (Leu Val Phe Tyr preference) [Bartonella clarridgeiae]CBI75871.1 aminopeptidase [Bartonella clarridgeiae 73]
MRFDIDEMISPEMLDRLAEVAIKVGLNLQEGQDLVLTAPVKALPLVRRITYYAYKAGAGVITPLFGDEALSLIRFENAHSASFDCAPSWLYEGMAKAFENGAARLAIVGDDPLLFSNQDLDKISRLNKATSMAYQPALNKISNFTINWSIIAYPTPEWAIAMFSDLPLDKAVQKLAEAIFSASRVTQDNAVYEWHAHNANLKQRSSWLNEQRFAALHFIGPGTNLTVGLADEHEWHGGTSIAQNGVVCNPNIPTEEVFTTPHAYKVDGFVRSTKPLSYQGTLIDNIEVRFEEGRIINASASKGQEVLQRVLQSDEGASRLGEVALVPHSSPISKSGLLFYNTLFDENAACHIALGQCYSKCFLNGAALTAEDIAMRGGNKSIIHIDWMIGSNEINIDGIMQDGAKIPVFRRGEWV